MRTSRTLTLHSHHYHHLRRHRHHKQFLPIKNRFQPIPDSAPGDTLIEHQMTTVVSRHWCKIHLSCNASLPGCYTNKQCFPLISLFNPYTVTVFWLQFSGTGG